MEHDSNGQLTNHRVAPGFSENRGTSVYNNGATGNTNINTGSSFNLNDYNNKSKTSLVSTATSFNHRRRFSMKLNQPPTEFIPTAVPPLPFNAQNQIFNNSFTSINDTMSIQSGMDDSNVEFEKPGIQHQNYSRSVDTMIRDVESNNTDQLIQYDNADSDMEQHQHHQNLLNALKRESFDATDFIRTELQNTNAQNIDDFSNYVESLNISNNESIKTSLTEFTNQIITLSETFKTTHEVLLSLKPKVHDLAELLSQQLDEATQYMESEDNSNENEFDSKIRNRQSVMMLQTKWSNSMKKVYSNIDRAHDLLPPRPSRRILIESFRWGELNSITFKPIRLVSIIIMNDSILVSSRIKESSQYLNSATSPEKAKKVRYVATNCWMMNQVVVQKCSQIKEFKNMSLGNTSNSKAASNNKTASESMAELTVAITSTENNQTFLFNTDVHSEFIRVYNAIEQAKNEVSSIKRKNMRESLNKINLLNLNQSDSRHVSISGTESLSCSHIEKQFDPIFHLCISNIDELLTLSSLDLGLHRYEDCSSYLRKLQEEISNLKQIAIHIGIPEPLLTSKLFNTTSKNGEPPSDFLQQVHLVYNVKLTSWKKLTDQLVSSLLEEITLDNNNRASLKGYVKIFKSLKREKEVAEVYLDARGIDLSDLVSTVNVGGDYSGSDANDLMNSQSNGLLNTSGSILRNSSTRRSNGTKGHSRRPSSMSSTLAMEITDQGVEAEEQVDASGGVTGEVITAYIRELSLVYAGFISRTWDEWNTCFIEGNEGSKSSDSVLNVQIIEWVNEHIEQLIQSIGLALMDYDRNGDTFKSCVKMVKDIFSILKEKELNVDYMLNI